MKKTFPTWESACAAFREHMAAVREARSNCRWAVIQAALENPQGGENFCNQVAVAWTRKLSAFAEAERNLQLDL